MDSATWTTAAGRTAVDVFDLAAPPAQRTRLRGLDELDGWWTFGSMPQNMHLAAYGEARARSPFNNGRAGRRPPPPRAADVRARDDGRVKPRAARDPDACCGPVEPAPVAGLDNATVALRAADASPAPSSTATAARQSRWKRFQVTVTRCLLAPCRS
ncbi:Hypothetical protein CINCED_3A020650 [Cinara cedri]|uniref:Uncharacterized protein n=1 Tax=Cinara cedri TaxID=506608 RepID=A0A5E4M8N3_9HEMI|nr:Hypothetical protein CINCED_3A020650 [Cinara cedri]